MSDDNGYRDETIQVAAVAAAMVEDDDYGVAEFLFNPTKYNALERQGERVLKDIAAERMAQDDKWGPQHHDRITWFAILMEEVGELAEELLAEDIDEDWSAMLEGYAYEILFRAATTGQKARRWLGRRFA